MADLINYRLNLISHGWSALVVDMARSKYRLKPPLMKILTVIARHQPISPSELVMRTSSDSPKVARAVRALTELGLIARVTDPLDGRRAALNVTPKGAKVFEDLDHCAQQVEACVTESLTATERKHLYGILHKLETTIQQQLRSASRTPATASVTGDVALRRRLRQATGR